MLSSLYQNSELLGLLWWLSGKESACNVGDLGFIPGWEDPLEEEMGTHSSFLPGEFTDTPANAGDLGGKSGSYGMWNHPRGHVWNVFVGPASS